jgi:hypothetical protein
VRLAKDGVLVVIHDATLARTGLTSGEVAKLTSDQLANVNIGSWFNRAHPTLACDEFEQQRVPTLAQVFDLLRERPGIIYVELKTDGADASSNLVQAVSDAIIASGFQDRVVAVSFDLPAVAEIKSLNPSIRTGALFAPQRRPNVTAAASFARTAQPYRAGWPSQSSSRCVDCGRSGVASASQGPRHPRPHHKQSGSDARSRNSVTFRGGLLPAGSFRGRTCPAIERRTSAASKRKASARSRLNAARTCESRTSHVSSSVLSFVLNIRR